MCKDNHYFLFRSIYGSSFTYVFFYIHHDLNQENCIFILYLFNFAVPLWHK
jgi:hypothetical protein